MKCSLCGSPETRVLETRKEHVGAVTRRRRGCSCGHAFDTYEIHGGIWPTVKKWAVESHAVALSKAQVRHHRDQQIVEMVRRGEKRYLVAEHFGLSVNMVSHITRKAGLPAFSRFKQEKGERT